MDTYTYEEAKERLIEYLQHDIDAHLSGKVANIGNMFDEFDARLPRCDNPRFNKLFVALNFWDAWCDARTHHWTPYDHIHEHEWPVFAQSIVTDLKADADITNQRVRAHYDFSSRQGWFHTLKERFFPSVKKR